MKNNTKKKIIILVLLTFLFTGCTQQLYDKDNKESSKENENNEPSKVTEVESKPYEVEYDETDI